MGIERSLVLLKPDALERRLVGEITSRFERCDLTIVAAKLVQATATLIDQHYREETLAPILAKKSEDAGTHIRGDASAFGRMVLGWNRSYMIRGPIIAMVFDGTKCIQRIRAMVGFTDPSKAAPGTIRFDYGKDALEIANSQKRGVENLVHASADLKEAKFEIALWFPELQP